MLQVGERVFAPGLRLVQGAGAVDARHHFRFGCSVYDDQEAEETDHYAQLHLYQYTLNPFN